MTKVIGKISATEKMPSTIDDFYFWTDKKQILSPFDIIKVDHENNSVTYGVVEEINHVTDAPSHFTSYISSDFGDTSEGIGNMNRLGMNYVKARVVSNNKGVYTPVLDGRQVRLCDADDVRHALGLTKEDVKHPLVCGYLEMYNGEDAIKVKVSLNTHFLIGPDGAHLNVSGISGLAAKTSYSMFLLNALQQKFRTEHDTDPHKETAAFVLFNVKGRDLMAIDEPNLDLSDSDRKLYGELGLKAEPFKKVRYFYPYGKYGEEKVQTYASSEDVRAQRKRSAACAYKYTLGHSLDMLDLLLADEDDSTGTLESCVNKIMSGEDPFRNLEQWNTLKEKIATCATAGNAATSKEIQVASWRKFQRCIKKAIGNDIFSKDVLNNEVELPDEIANHLAPGDVMVIDIARLDENTQSFVFGSVARAIYELKLGATRSDIPDKVIIFVDELNKYASADTPKSSPILKQILDIAERGRSLGIILFSVEQFRSAIHDRVKGNCATQAYGRTNAIEVSKSDYRYIPKVYQNMMTRLQPGEYIISNPALRSLVNIRFPRPLYRQFPNG